MTNTAVKLMELPGEFIPKARPAEDMPAKAQKGGEKFTKCLDNKRAETEQSKKEAPQQKGGCNPGIVTQNEREYNGEMPVPSLLAFLSGNEFHFPSMEDLGPSETPEGQTSQPSHPAEAMPVNPMVVPRKISINQKEKINESADVDEFLQADGEDAPEQTRPQKENPFEVILDVLRRNKAAKEGRIKNVGVDTGKGLKPETGKAGGNAGNVKNALKKSLDSAVDEKLVENKGAKQALENNIVLKSANLEKGRTEDSNQPKMERTGPSKTKKSAAFEKMEKPVLESANAEKAKPGDGAPPVKTETVNVKNMPRQLERIMADYWHNPSKETSRVTLKLDPPGLGEVDVRLHIEKGVLSSRFDCSAETAQVIKDSISQLKVTLQQHGIVMGDSQINYGYSQFSQKDHQHRQEHDRGVTRSDNNDPAEPDRMPSGEGVANRVNGISCLV